MERERAEKIQKAALATRTPRAGLIGQTPKRAGIGAGSRSSATPRRFGGI